MREATERSNFLRISRTWSTCSLKSVEYTTSLASSSEGEVIVAGSIKVLPTPRAEHSFCFMWSHEAVAQGVPLAVAAALHAIRAAVLAQVPCGPLDGSWITEDHGHLQSLGFTPDFRVKPCSSPVAPLVSRGEILGLRRRNAPPGVSIQEGRFGAVRKPLSGSGGTRQALAQDGVAL